ncbi:IS1380 family transposase [Acidiferrimicrobium sp. IK]|uniref:IS1380 family transposase n=1 Tax=Acidiferrimicrobium sp. IK TaxID=2871700 RepID=UPI0021CB55DD|nr:IS1380 family transposase [Acidiferrimicrobium sp. IK]MCU4187532.1 IS1380 family transposase [Acidiferrimicrobium sp. IK]
MAVLYANQLPDQKGIFWMRVSRSVDRVGVTFDDTRLVADAGLLLVASLSGRLALEAMVNDTVDLGDRPGAFAPGRKVLTLAHAMAAGAGFIDDVDILRSGATAQVVGHRVMAPSTVGTFLRSFSFGHVRQLDRVNEIALSRAWAAGAGPEAILDDAGEGTVEFVDVDSTILETHGHAKQGATFGYTHRRGYHPLLATRAASGEVLHLRFRKGSANTARGMKRFVEELAARLRRLPMTAPVVIRADSGFHSAKTIAACRQAGFGFSITARQTTVIRAAIAGIAEHEWVPMGDYPDSGVAELAETELDDGTRLIVRRTIVLDPAETLFALWRHHAFVTDRAGTAVALDLEHRQHAIVELTIRDLKNGPLAHCPSGSFPANSAWAAIAVLAHNLLRWTATIGGIHTGPVVAKTIRRRYIALPGRITRSARRHTLHLPARWPWRKQWTIALDRIRALPQLT